MSRSETVGEPPGTSSSSDSAENPETSNTSETLESSQSTQTPKDDIAADAAADEEAKPGWIERLWIRSGLTVTLCQMMVKGACGPVVALALFQWRDFARFYTTLDFLIAISTILSFTFLPRAKFFQNLLYNIIAVCFGSCVNLLMCYSSVKAREHTTDPNAPPDITGRPIPGSITVGYNSSASAVSAIWHFFDIMFANALRFKYPQLQGVVILYSINADIAAVYAPQLPTMAAAESFVRRLLLTYLTGFAIGLIVHLIIFPTTSRQVCTENTKGYLAALKRVMAAERNYLQSMESASHPGKDHGDGEEMPHPVVASTKTLKDSIVAMTALHGKYAQDLVFAKRELAWGKLSAKDLDKIFKLLRQILLPCLGIGAVADVFERVAQGQGWGDFTDGIGHGPNPEVINCQQDRDREAWAEVMEALHDPFQDLVEAMSSGLTHVGYNLEVNRKPQTGPWTFRNKKETDNNNGPDVEAEVGSAPRPGSKGFAEYLEQRTNAFSKRTNTVLRAWCKRKGISDAVMNPSGYEKQGLPPLNRVVTRTEKERRHVYMILYMEFLLWSTADAVLNLVKFSDEKVASGQMSRANLIVPGAKRLKKWGRSLFVPEDDSTDAAPNSAATGTSDLNVPTALRTKKDPEHLPPANRWEKMGEAVRRLTNVFESTEMAFGFRVAVATMSISVMSYLRPTQRFFTYQRIFWAEIAVSISMTMTSGSGLFAFSLRLIGTISAAIIAIVLWYIAGGRGIPGAVLPLLFLVFLPEVYCFITKPRYLTAWLVLMITEVIILGYELESEVIGLETLQRNGQDYHPIYVLAFIRVAAIAAGLVVALFWTYVPYPLTARNAIRRRLGDSIYLLAVYYSCVHSTIKVRIEGSGGDPDQKGTPSHELRKRRFKMVPRMLSLLGEMRQHLSHTKFELNLGGRFPKQQYVELVQKVNDIFNYISLVDFATATYSTARNDTGQYQLDRTESRHVHFGEPRPQGASAGSTASSYDRTEGQEAEDASRQGSELDSATWLHDLARVRREVALTTEEITSTLTLLSFSLSNAQPLPPFVRPPQSFSLAIGIRKIDPDILSIRHVTEPGYAAFAVTQVASRLISADIEKLLDLIRDLVGEVNFDFTPAPRKSGRTVAKASKGKAE